MVPVPLELSADLGRVVREALEAAYPEEGCGLLAGRPDDGSDLDGDVRRVQAVVPLPNAKDAERTRRYLIPPEAYMQAERELAGRGLQVVGFYHSHPDHPAQPSAFDLDWAWPWYSYLIVSVQQGRAAEERCWVLRDDRSGFDEQEVLKGNSTCPAS